MCITYTAACETIDYVMEEIVNKTEESVVYIDSGEYNYSITADKADNNNETNGYSHCMFSLIGYVANNHVVASDINTYPVIRSGVNNDNTRFAFSFVINVTGTFQYIKFVIGSTTGGYKSIIGTNEDDSISVSMIDCAFCSEYMGMDFELRLIFIEYGSCLIKNSL
jgi:hypothetical protein